MNFYGYGRSNINYEESSEKNHVCFVAEESIPLDGVHFYELYLPEEFITQSGKKEIAVSLVYNPPVMGTRIDYFWVKLSFILFKNASVEELERHSSRLVRDDNQQDEEESYAFQTIPLQPNNRIRSKGLHQKGSVIYTRTPHSIEINKPLVLGVFCKGNWLKKEDNFDFNQNYSVVITLRHQAMIDLYNRIVQMIRTRIRV